MKLKYLMSAAAIAAGASLLAPVASADESPFKFRTVGTDQDFVQIANVSDGPADIGRYELRIESRTGGHTIVIPEGQLPIEPDENYTVVGHKFKEKPGEPPCQHDQVFSPDLVPDNGTVSLVRAGVVIDSRKLPRNDSVVYPC